MRHGRGNPPPGRATCSPHLARTDPLYMTAGGGNFGMTWQHLLRTVSVAAIGAAALFLASQARAEGGEGPSLVPVDRVAAEDEIVSAEGDSQRSEALAAEAAEDVQAPAEKPAGRDRARLSDAVRGRAMQPLILRHATENGLPFELADAVIRLESRYNAGARNGPHMGLTQINIRTAQSLGYQGPAAGLLDAETNLRYGLKYLAQAYRLAGGDICGTILRYQAGHRTQAMTPAARTYCAKVKVITASAD